MSSSASLSKSFVSNPMQNISAFPIGPKTGAQTTEVPRKKSQAVKIKEMLSAAQRIPFKTQAGFWNQTSASTEVFKKKRDSSGGEMIHGAATMPRMRFEHNEHSDREGTGQLKQRSSRKSTKDKGIGSLQNETLVNLSKDKKRKISMNDDIELTGKRLGNLNDSKEVRRAAGTHSRQSNNHKLNVDMRSGSRSESKHSLLEIDKQQ